MNRCFVIAEAGVNHNGSLRMALDLVEAAGNAGADAVKFQTFQSDKVISARAPKAQYQMLKTPTNESQLEMVRKFELCLEDHQHLKAASEKAGVEFMSSPFDADSVNLLCGLGVRRIKLASGEITNAPLLLTAASTGLPVVLSTGMACLGEIEAALGVLAFGMCGCRTRPTRQAFEDAYRSEVGVGMLEKRVTLLHCTTEYPAPFKSVNLRAMETLRISFGLPVGLSDHSPGHVVAVAATAMRATIIEKHLTLDTNLPGPDHKASLDPEQFAAMVMAIRQVEEAMGTGRKVLQDTEITNRFIARRSLVAGRVIQTGDVFDADALEVKRPGSGRSPFDYWDVLGSPATKHYEEDDFIE